jgi:hypothetical protein
MGTLPTGTVTFLFTDIEGSAELLQRLGDRRYRPSPPPKTGCWRCVIHQVYEIIECVCCA